MSVNVDVVVDWLEPVARTFFFLTGFLGLAATVLLVVHMGHTWHKIKKVSQRLMYYSLLAFSMIVTSASIEQIHDDSSVNWHDVATFLATILLAIACISSIVADSHDRSVTER